MLNIEFQGYVYDDSGNKITEYIVRGIHFPSKKENTYSFNKSQYTLNLGDGDWLTPNGRANNPGDYVILAFETTEENIFDRYYAFIKIELTGDDYYINNVYLRKCHKPKILEFSFSKFLVNEEITANIVATDNYEYTENGLTHYQHSFFEGVDIFSDRVGIVSKLIKWEDEYEENLTHTYNNPIEKNIELKVINKCGKEDLLIIPIKVVYDKPTIDFVFNDYPTIKDSPLNIELLILSGKNTIRNIEIYYDDVFLLNVNEETTFNVDLGNKYVESHKLTAKIFYNDGFEDKVFSYYETIHMSNIPQDFRVEAKRSDNLDIIVTLKDIKDEDGNVDDLMFKYKFMLYNRLLDTHFLIYETDFINDKTYTLKNFFPGEFKIIVESKDPYGVLVERETTIILNNIKVCALKVTKHIKIVDNILPNIEPKENSKIFVKPKEEMSPLIKEVKTLKAKVKEIKDKANIKERLKIRH